MSSPSHNLRPPRLGFFHRPKGFPVINLSSREKGKAFFSHCHRQPPTPPPNSSTPLSFSGSYTATSSNKGVELNPKPPVSDLFSLDLQLKTPNLVITDLELQFSVDILKSYEDGADFSVVKPTVKELVELPSHPGCEPCLAGMSLFEQGIQLSFKPSVWEPTWEVVAGSSLTVFEVMEKTQLIQTDFDPFMMCNVEPRGESCLNGLVLVAFPKMFVGWGSIIAFLPNVMDCWLQDVDMANIPPPRRGFLPAPWKPPDCALKTYLLFYFLSEQEAPAQVVLINEFYSSETLHPQTAQLQSLRVLVDYAHPLMVYYWTGPQLNRDVWGLLPFVGGGKSVNDGIRLVYTDPG